MADKIEDLIAKLAAQYEQNRAQYEQDAVQYEQINRRIEAALGWRPGCIRIAGPHVRPGTPHLL